MYDYFILFWWYKVCANLLQLGLACQKIFPLETETCTNWSVGIQTVQEGSTCFKQLYLLSTKIVSVQQNQQGENGGKKALFCNKSSGTQILKCLNTINCAVPRKMTAWSWHSALEELIFFLLLPSPDYPSSPVTPPYVKG